MQRCPRSGISTRRLTLYHFEYAVYDADTCFTVITQVFPDEFHLNTLDQLLPAIAKLNPHVNIKAIVIGLMNRLAAYAERESESESLEERKKTEEEATARLLERLRISKEGKATETLNGPEQANGERTNGDAVSKSGQDSVEPAAESSTAEPAHDADKIDGVKDGDDSERTSSVKSRGIPGGVKLYEIFYGQVTHLIHAQRLPIQDTIALLVSLANLAL